MGLHLRTEIGRSIWFAGLLFLLLSTPLDAQESLHSQWEKSLQRWFAYESNLAYDGHPGLLIDLIAGDSLWTYTFAFPAGESDVLTDSSLFELGGCTQVFTALLLDSLVREGRLKYHTPVNLLLPSQYRNARWGSLNLGQLASHTSGLPAHFPGFGRYSRDPDQPFRDYPYSQLLEDFRRYKDSPPGDTAYFYSHTNYALLGIALSFSEKAPFPELWDRYVKKPLHLPDACFEAEERNPLVPGTDKTGEKIEAWKSGGYEPAIGQKASARDLRLLLRQLMAHAPRYLCLKPKYPTGRTNGLWATCGWHVYRTEDYYPIYLQGGHTKGHRVFLAFVPATRTAVVVLAKSTQSLEGLGWAAIGWLNNGFNR